MKPSHGDVPSVFIVGVVSIDGFTKSAVQHLKPCDEVAIGVHSFEDNVHPIQDLQC